MFMFQYLDNESIEYKVDIGTPVNGGTFNNKKVWL